MDMVTKRSIVTMTFAALIVAAHGLRAADEFRLTVASPVAAGTPRVKFAMFVFRVDGCPEPAQAHVTATAEGIVNGARRSVRVALVPLDNPGVYAVKREWAAEGRWIVVLRASYHDLHASALVVVDDNGFLREPSRFFPREPTAAEIESALSASAQTGGKQ